MEPKSITIITVPLVCRESEIYWGVYEEHHGKVRKHIKDRPNAGRQISFAYQNAFATNNNILLVADDKFGIEKSKDEDPLDSDLMDFLSKHPIPISWEKSSRRFIAPPKQFRLTDYSFSEKKLLKSSKMEYGLPGECANEWAKLLEWLEKQGYEKVEAYFPKVCAKGICYGTPYAKGSGIYTKPLEIFFTDKDRIDSKI